MRKIFKTAFERVGLPYVNPHSIRDTLTQFSYTLNLSPEQLKAWSQNMGHDHVLTTLTCYGQVPLDRQAKIMHDGGCGACWRGHQGGTLRAIEKQLEPCLGKGWLDS